MSIGRVIAADGSAARADDFRLAGVGDQQGGAEGELATGWGDARCFPNGLSGLDVQSSHEWIGSTVTGKKQRVTDADWGTPVSMNGGIAK